MVIPIFRYFTVLMAASVSLLEVHAEENPWEAVKSWRFEIEAEIPELDGTPSTPRYFLRKIIAAASPNRFYHYLGHYHEGNRWDLEPRNQEAVISNGLRFHQFKFNRTFSIRPLPKGEVLPGTLNGDTLFFVVPAWPASDYQVPGSTTTETVFIIGEAVKSGSYKSLGIENLSGESCEKFQSDDGSDTFWLYADRPLCLHHREIRDPVTHRLLQRTTTTQVKELQPGLWMPVVYQNLVFDRNSGDDSEPIRRAHFRIVDWKIDEDDVLFEPIVQSGSMRRLESGDFVQVTSGGTELLTEIITHLRDVDGVAVRRESLSWRNCILGLVLGAVLGIWYHKSRGRG